MDNSFQTSLFEDDIGSKSVSYLNIIKDMEPAYIDTEEIFDTVRFQELYAVTYVASPVYFFNHTKNFLKVELIIGIDDSNVVTGFTQGILNKLNIDARVDFWKEMDGDLKEKFINNQYSIRYAAGNVAIHSKIYLLKGEKDFRCVIGSANFTASAFEAKPQFEDILIFDNNIDLFNLYMDRFKEIKRFTEDYIPARIKNNKIDQILVNDPDTITEIIKDEVLSPKIKFQVTDKQMEEIIENPIVKKNRNEVSNKVKQLIELVTKKNKEGNRLPVSKVQFEKKLPEIKTVVRRTHKITEEIDTRDMVICNAINYLLYSSSDKNRIENQEGELVLISKEITIEEIKEKLLLIHRFIDAYKLFTLKEDLKNQSRIYELILYGFMSTYLWKAREHYALHEGREGSRRDISPFLIIAGRSMSGKTTALEFLGKLIGGRSSNFISYESLKSANALEDFFETENLHPILIDEMSLSFFTGKRGERIIKYISNQLCGQHPALIGTTNASGFNIPAQATSRIYYLQIENTFDKKKKSESSTYLYDILQKVDNKLFCDFSFRISQKIVNDEKFYEPKDYLIVAREIFREYYWLCNLEMPNYFPNEPFNDYDERSKLIWKELYRSYRESFELRSDNTISIKIENFSSNSKERQTKINYLPIECIIEDEPVLVVKKDLFFAFIEESRRKGFLKKIKKILGNN